MRIALSIVSVVLCLWGFIPGCGIDTPGKPNTVGNTGGSGASGGKTGTGGAAGAGDAADTVPDVDGTGGQEEPDGEAGAGGHDEPDDGTGGQVAEGPWTCVVPPNRAYWYDTDYFVPCVLSKCIPGTGCKDNADRCESDDDCIENTVDRGAEPPGSPVHCCTHGRCDSHSGPCS